MPKEKVTMNGRIPEPPIPPQNNLFRTNFTQSERNKKSTNRTLDSEMLMTEQRDLRRLNERGTFTAEIRENWEGWWRGGGV